MMTVLAYEYDNAEAHNQVVVGSDEGTFDHRGVEMYIASAIVAFACQLIQHCHVVEALDCLKIMKEEKLL